MDATSVLALQGDLYRQLTDALDEINALRRENIDLREQLDRRTADADTSAGEDALDRDRREREAAGIDPPTPEEAGQRPA